MRFIIIYSILTSILLIANILITFNCFTKKWHHSTVLGIAGSFAILVGISYYLSVIIKNQFGFALFSSFYFMSIDLLLLSFNTFILLYTGLWKKKAFKILMMSLAVYGIFEMVVFLINPFNNIAISYYPRPTSFGYAEFEYKMDTLYILHLVYTYLMVVISLCILSYKAAIVAKEYKPQYIVPMSVIILIVLINLAFLFINNLGNLSYIDHSIFFYTVAYVSLYYGCFLYTRGGMVHSFKESVFNTIDQAIILFDDEGEMVFSNEKMNNYIEETKDMYLYLDNFIDICKFDTEFMKESSGYSFQFYLKKNNETLPLRCDYKVIMSGKKALGKLFSFTNIISEIDLLTEFEFLDNFRKIATENPEKYKVKASVGVIDVNGLSIINRNRGHQQGDRIIKDLSLKMIELFPNDSLFIRGEEASLIVVCFGKSEDYIKNIFQSIAKGFETYLEYCTSFVNLEHDVLEAISCAYKGMRVKKLLDENSTHSSTIASLIRALEETDSDTKAHVKRTQELGEKLGMRIKLSYVHQSKLALLCLLHDIGKIGIPLEVLNKPGRLTDEEMEILKTHVTKGYTIAKSSSELESIADFIRYHHERWDGKGYPSGLKREEIPVLSRIISIVDAYDAMTHDRVYRKKMPVEDALKEIERCSGSQFDPFIAQEFIEMIREDDNIMQNQSAGEMVCETMTTSDDTRIEEMTIGSVHKVEYAKYILDDEERIIECDDNFTKLTGYSKNEILNNEIMQFDLIPERERSEYIYLVQEEMGKNQKAFFEHHLVNKAGNEIYVFCYGRRYFDSISKRGRSEIIITDLENSYSMQLLSNKETERARERIKLIESTYKKDSLTGLYTKDLFKDKIEEMLSNPNYTTALFVIDVNNFKLLNMQYGFSKGDEYLISISQKLEAFAVQNGFAARIGGDEFALGLFFDSKISYNEIKVRLRTVYDALCLSLTLKTDILSVTMGCTISNDPKINFNECFQNAYNALYQAKEKNTGFEIA